MRSPVIDVIEEDSTDSGPTLLLRTDGASCALWPRGPRAPDGRVTGCIGRFEATSEAAARALLERACAELARRGVSFVVGPLDGNTWYRYRLVVESSKHPPFVLEPAHPPEWPAWWRAAGFAPVERYHSSLAEEAPTDAVPPGAADDLPVRTLDPSRFEEELRRVYELSAIAFAENPYYAPITWEAFAALHDALRSRLEPRLVLLAEDPSRPGSLAGFLLALPDALEQERTGRCRTLILKSMAVDARYRSRGLGARLILSARRIAAELGMKRSIFALMHDDNRSARIAIHDARVIRRYALFGRELGG